MKMKGRKVSTTLTRKRLILTALVALGLCSCGVTSARISKPQQGTVTTVTITTNNPITTDVAPDIQLNQK